MLALQGVDEGPISQELGLIRVCSNGVIAGLKRTIGFRDLVLLQAACLSGDRPCLLGRCFLGLTSR